MVVRVGVFVVGLVAGWNEDREGLYLIFESTGIIYVLSFNNYVMALMHNHACKWSHPRLQIANCLFPITRSTQ